MDKHQELLAKLHDIHLPDTPSWWPPAVGWYILAVLVLIIVCGIIWGISCIFKATKVKRNALRDLRQYEKAYLLQKNPTQTCANISAVLKRVALVYFPREKVAGLYGQAWIDFLNQTAKKNINFEPVRTELIMTPYTGNCKTAPNLNVLFMTAKAWVRHV